MNSSMSLHALGSILLRGRYRIVLFAALSSALALTLGIFDSRTYTTSAAFTPQAPERSSNDLSFLAGQIGIDYGQGSSTHPTETPEFYAELLRSRRILGQLLEEPVLQEGLEDARPEAIPLIDLIGIEDSSPSLRQLAGIQWLESRILPQVTRETGIVYFTVTTEWAHISEWIGHRLLELVGEFNREIRQTQAGLERRFIEERILEAESQLQIAEEELKAFLDTNRQFQSSPELVFEYERLQRRVTMRQELFTSHQKAYESARIEEVRDTPVITLIEEPELPALPDPRRLLFKTILAGALGASVGAIFVIASHTLREGELNNSVPAGG